MATIKLKRIKPKLLTIKEAAVQLGLSEQVLRTALQQKVIEVGFAVKGEGGRWTYRIFQHKIDDFLKGGDSSAA